MARPSASPPPDLDPTQLHRRLDLAILSRDVRGTSLNMAMDELARRTRVPRTPSPTPFTP